MTDASGNMIMPVTPYYGGSSEGMFGGNGAWWIVILLILFGWGGNNGFGGNNGSMQRGFDQNAVMNGISGIQSTLSNGFSQAEVAANNRQMNEVQQLFGIQTSLQQCCCDNRAATADLKYTIATESANTRTNCDNNNQKILDKLCQLELDGIKQNYEGQLRTMQNQLAAAQAENQSLKFVASQGAQTAQILANNEAQTTALERYLAPTPIPAYVVQNPNCCGQNFGVCSGYAG